MGGGTVLQAGFYNMDCMDGMRQFPDGFFDLAIVDPPYGDAGSEFARGGGGTVWTEVRTVHGADSARACERTGGTWAEKYGKKIIAWDVAPDQSYFDELFRVSRNQIIWGGNYFPLPPTRCFLVWDKCQSNDFSMAAAEYAWTSYNKNAKLFRHTPQGTAKEQRFHPTQKPVALYSWICGLYCQPGMRVLDTHVGSASSLVAFHRAGLQYWGFEIDQTYYQKAAERLANEQQQISINDLLAPHVEQIGL